MRTNRVGNAKRFFDIKDTDRVLEIGKEIAEVDEKLNYDYIFCGFSKSVPISLKALYEALNANGKLVLFADNAFSLHAFSEGKVTKNGVSYAYLKKLISGIEANSIRWYYPYPCIEFPAMIFSNKRLPQSGECEDNFYNFDHARIEAFEERTMTDAAVLDGMYPYLANSYMVVLSKAPLDGLMDYTRFSNERREELCIRTDLYTDRVEKRAVSPSAKEHVLHMQLVKDGLQAALDGIQVLGKPCVLNEIIRSDEAEGKVVFDYAYGRSLEQILDDLCRQGKEQEVSEILLAVCRQIIQSPVQEPFKVSPRYEEIFGRKENIEQYGFKSFPVSDIDFVCQNILVGDKATVIDYEWSFEFPVPSEFLVFRFLYFYLEAKNRTFRESEAFADLYEKAGITEEKKELFLEMETAFQHYVQHGANVLCNNFDVEGKPVITRKELDEKIVRLEAAAITLVNKDGKRITVLPSGQKNGIYVYEIFDLAQDSHIELTGYVGERVLRLGAMANENGRHVGVTIHTNGFPMGGLLYLYEDGAPTLTLSGLPKDRACDVKLSVEEICISKDALREWKTSLKDLRFLVENREQQIRDLKNTTSWKVTKPLRRLKGNKED